MDKFELSFNNKKITIEINELARQADSSVLIRFDDTVVLSTVCCSKQSKNDSFMPLVVDYEEKQYAIGKIPNNFSRREIKNSEHKILSARLIDRIIRPMFNHDFRNEVQVVNTVMSFDVDSSSEVAAIFGTSLALCISDIPFSEPVAGVQIARINNEFIINPSLEQRKKSDIDLFVAGNIDTINMIEAGASQINEKEIFEALLFAHNEIKKLCLFQKELILKAGKKKREIVFISDQKIKNDIYSKINQQIKKIFLISDAIEQQKKINELKEEIISEYDNNNYQSEAEKIDTIYIVKKNVELIIAEKVRELIIEKKIRPDGRKLDEIRSLDAKIDFLPRTHGSALFTRGQTQVVSTTTLGTLNDKQLSDDLNGETFKYFFHHYNFPPYSVGEIGKIGIPGRREIGHGKLCEKALSYVIPSINEFPYTIRVVSDVLESNGSSSQASICAGCLSLMSAGVPIKEIVSGISIGLFANGDLNKKETSYTILTDIQGIEDFFGDMDFKIAGTKNGITALQLDTKIKGINYEVIKKSLAQAKKAREEIRIFMENIIKKPREKVGEYALKFKKINIDVSKISELIGSGGKNINNIISKCDNCIINIENNGEIIIYHVNNDKINQAIKMIKNVVKDVKIGDIFTGIIKRIENYGIFVNLFANIDGLCHISEISNQFNNINLNNNFKIGDTIKVKIIDINEKGQIKLSQKLR